MPASTRAVSRSFPAGPTNGLPSVFLIAGLFADEDYSGLGTGAFAENGLGGISPEIAGFAVAASF